MCSSVEVKGQPDLLFVRNHWSLDGHDLQPPVDSGISAVLVKLKSASASVALCRYLIDQDDSKINTSRFYFEWAGHTIPDITAFHSIVKTKRPDKPIVYLAGDSSFDNKHWVPSSGPGGDPLPVKVPSIYNLALQRPQPKPDVAFWLNHLLGDRATALNCAVEATTLQQRNPNILEHDVFIRDHIGTEDILLVSVGGNDIALKPTFATICRMLQLAWLTPKSSLQRGSAWSLDHFTDLFKSQVEAYVSRLVEKQKPKAVVVCMIYYPLEAGVSKQRSWADTQLRLLGYDRFPGQLQTAISKIFELATKKVRVPGVQIVPCALYEAMDGKNEEDYTDRVEPSVEGGRKMASKLMEIIDLLMPLCLLSATFILSHAMHNCPKEYEIRDTKLLS